MANVIVLAVKPQTMKEALTPFSGRLSSQLVISIAAGIQCVDLAKWLGSGASYGNLVRAMPNTPGAHSCRHYGPCSHCPEVSAEGKRAAETLLGAVGETAWFEHEPMLDAVTAVSGSGPAYVFYFIEALEQAALDMGFTPPVARKFALQTFLGGGQACRRQR